MFCAKKDEEKLNKRLKRLVPSRQEPTQLMLQLLKEKA